MIVLFKKGDRLINGVRCEPKLFNEFNFEPYLEEGWVLDPKDLLKPGPEPEPEPKPEPKPEKDKYEEKLNKAVKETKEALDAVEDLKKSKSLKKKVSK